MGELIQYTPESEAGSERFFWDNVIRGFEILGEVDEDIDAIEELEALRNEEKEDALTILFNRTLQVTVPEGESSNLSEVFSFLVEQGFLAAEGSPEDYR